MEENINNVFINNANKENTPSNAEFNNGERLYYQELAKNEIERARKENYAKKIEEDLCAELTFKPSFSYSNPQYQNVSSKVYDELPAKTDLNQKKVSELDLENLKQSKKNLTKEQIDNLSNKLSKEKEDINKKIEKLRTNIQNKIYPFTPSINKTSKQNPFSDKKFIERMDEWNKNRFKKTQQKFTETGKDNATGQVLFVPKVNEHNFKKGTRTGKIHENLYNHGMAAKNHRKNIYDPDNVENEEKCREDYEISMQVKEDKIKQKYNIGGMYAELNLFKNNNQTKEKDENKENKNGQVNKIAQNK